MLLEHLENDTNFSLLHFLQSWITFCPHFNLGYIVENIVG